MAKIKSVKSNTEVYAEIIADIASRAAAEIEGGGTSREKPRQVAYHQRQRRPRLR